jgi:hypothetical protein
VKVSDQTKAYVEMLKRQGLPELARQAEAMLATPEAPPATPEIPAAPMVPAPVAAAHAAGPQPPPGKAPLQTIDEWEALPQDERIARMDECDALVLEGKK